ncbi:MAG: hypothetical protein V4607_11265, partial [Pseudomonadota bacterium]
TFAADKKAPPVKPPTRKTQVIRAEVYKKMDVAQKAFEAKDYNGAIAALDSMKAGYEKLNDYEKATLWNMYGATYYTKGDTKSALNAYINVLQQKDLPDGLRDGSLHTLAQLYFITEEYDKAISVVKKWMAVMTSPQPDGYVLMAQAYYQKKNYKLTETNLLQALQIARTQNMVPKENWLALLRAVFYEEKQYLKSAKVLEILVSLYPENGSYWQQLAGMNGILERQQEQMYILHGAYRAELLKNESDYLNLARLYMVQDIPYPAAQLLAKGMKAKVIKINAETLQLYAQALVMAKEYERQIPVLTKLTEMTGESKHYVYLAQAYFQIDKWPEASEALRSALKAKNVTKPAEIQVQLGNALYNSGKLEQARDMFAAAAKNPSTAESAANWVKFVSTEIERKKALGK